MKRIENIDSKLQSICASDVELKESAKRVCKNKYLENFNFFGNEQNIF